MSKLVVELLEEMAPILERAMLLCEAAARAPAEAKVRFREAAERAEQELLPMLQGAQGGLEGLYALMVTPTVGGGEGKHPEGAPPPPNPRPSNHGGQVGEKGDKSHKRGVANAVRLVRRHSESSR
jgi:hypothetical protein